MGDLGSIPIQISSPPPALRERLRRYVLLVRLHRPIGIFLLLWPALWALWIAGQGHPPWRIVAVFVMGVVLMRSAGCAINDYADRHFDGRVRRTRDRPLATGLVTPREALGVFAVLSLMAFGLAWVTLNPFTLALTVPAVCLAVIYPFLKRVTHLPQLVLGMAFGWAVPMAFGAIQGGIPAVGWWLFGATLVWATIYDTEYAMVDREDDLAIGIKSTAILFGQWDRLAVGLLQGLFLILMGWVGVLAGRGGFYYGLGLVASAGFSVYQQGLIRHREPRACFEAFLNNHFQGMLLFLALLADYGFYGLGGMR
ncbi:MAG: 4-hydroxybenzoate octaprenyltransferase [Pseudomonadota bacterium]